MRVSIALCTFNGAAYLSEQLASFERQTVLPDEIVVCDDGSSDTTLDLVKNFAERYPVPVRLFENGTNLGSTKNFEKAIMLCRGDVILLSDQDDVWEPEKVDKIRNAFLSNPDAAYVFTDAKLVGPDGRNMQRTLWNSVGFDLDRQLLFDRGHQSEVLLRRSIVTGATMGFRRTLLPLVCPICEDWVHDGWIALLSSASGRNGIALRDTLIAYRQHQSQQIGVKAPSIAGTLRKVGAGGDCMLQKERKRYEAILTRLTDHGFGSDPQAIMLIKDKVGHLANRLSIINSDCFSKARGVIREAFSGRYHRYSNSWSSIASDVFQR